MEFEALAFMEGGGGDSEATGGTTLKNNDIKDLHRFVYDWGILGLMGNQSEHYEDRQRPNNIRK